MYALLKNNICIGIHNLPLNETNFAQNEKQIELKDIENPLSVLGKTYSRGKFVETQKTGKDKQLEDNLSQMQFLRDTDWKVIRHRDQQEMGIPTSLTDEEYQTLLLERQKAREAVVNVE